LFLAYSSKDSDFVARLHADLQANGVRTWFAPEDLGSGNRLIDQIESAIRITDKVVLVLSDESMASEWVIREIRHLRRQEMRDHRQRLVPISLVLIEQLAPWRLVDSVTGLDAAEEIRQYFIADFSK
jgi:hypothetical protein